MRNRGNVGRKYKVNGMIIGGCVILFLVIFFGFAHFTQAVSSSAPSESVYKYYTSVQIKEGDTLHSIASEYMTAEYASMQDYIDEVVSLNGLKSTKIHAGEFLCVPYYSTEEL